MTTARSTVRETDIGKIAITPRGNDLPVYDILDLIVKEGRSYLSLQPRNTAGVSDTDWWLQITENSYDIAVRLEMFEGTEEEWITSLSAASEEAARLALETIEDCKEAALAANEAAGKAGEAAERSNELSDNRDKIVDGYWWRYNEETKAYENTGQPSKGNVMYALFEIDLESGQLIMETDHEYEGPEFSINENGELRLTI